MHHSLNRCVIVGFSTSSLFASDNYAMIKMIKRIAALMEHGLEFVATLSMTNRLQ